MLPSVSPLEWSQCNSNKLNKIWNELRAHQMHLMLMTGSCVLAGIYHCLLLESHSIAGEKKGKIMI